MPKKFSADNAGCFFDGVFGQVYNDVRVITLACRYGYDYRPNIIAEYGDDPDMWPTLEQYVEWFDTDATIDAVDYLNTHAVSDGVYFEWYDGNFCLVSENELEG